MRIKEKITNLRSSWLSNNVIRFVSTTLRKVRESSMEIGNTDVSVKDWTFSFPIIHLHSRSVLFNNPSFQFHQLFSPSFFFTPIFWYFSLRFSCLCCCCFNFIDALTYFGRPRQPEWVFLSLLGHKSFLFFKQQHQYLYCIFKTKVAANLALS